MSFSIKNSSLERMVNQTTFDLSTNIVNKNGSPFVNNSIAIGNNAGLYNQGFDSISIGTNNSEFNQGDFAISIGAMDIGLYGATGAQFNQNFGAVSIGSGSGGINQGTGAVAIGLFSGAINQGFSSIGIGSGGGDMNQASNSICFMAGYNDFSCETPGLFVNPVRIYSSTGFTGYTGFTGMNCVSYNPDTCELFANTAKTFVINHPVSSDRYLVHACVEGPESAVFYRGKGEITNNSSVEISLPEYVDKFATNFTVHITPIYDGFANKIYNASEVINGQFSVYGTDGKFHWTVFGQRDEIEIEPKKIDVDVKGFGPYTYL